MERREFLVGVGTLLTSAYIAKAEWFLEHQKSVVPLIKPAQAEETLYFVNTGFGYELRLNTIEFEFPELTFRQMLERYYGVDLPNDRALKISEYRELYYEHGVSPRDLDEIADFDWYVDAWGRRDACNAQAYHRLEHLDLFDYGSRGGKLIGGLNFIDGCHPGNDYLGVTADDALSASLLQARLLELDEKIKVELVEDAA